MRNKGLKVEQDLMARSAKAQMKYANKLNAKYVAILGEEELKDNCCSLKNMQTGENTVIKLDKVFEIIKEGK